MGEPSNKVLAKSDLTEAEKSRIERNRQRAVFLRDAKIKSNAVAIESDGKVSIKIAGSKFQDSQGGFLIAENDIEIVEEERMAKIAKLSEEEGSNLPIIYNDCIECLDEFAESYLLKNFGHSVCDKCK